MISAGESASKPASPPLFSLPPPCSYEDLYSSYQNEWDQQNQSNAKITESTPVKDVATVSPDIYASISGLEWVVLPSTSIENEKDAFLLACNGLGEILVWKLAKSTKDAANSATENKQDPPLLLKRHTRCRICISASRDDNHDGDSDSRALHGICVVKLATANNPAESSQRGRKRQRPNGNEEQLEPLVIVAGEGGLWSIPLLDLLEQPWEASVSPCSSQELPPSLLHLSSRPVQKIRISPSNGEEPQRLFALEQNTNTLCIWNLSVDFERHARNSDTNEPAPETRMDLSRIFEGALDGTKSKKRRRIQTQMNGSEHATAMSVVPSDKSQGLIALVGTDRSRLWIIPLPGSDENANELQPYFFSLQNERKPSLEETSSKTRGVSGRNAGTDAVWRVSDILATNSGTWWTVAAALGSKSSNRKHTGLLMSWHAPTGMVVARQETREAIQAIVQDRHLYSAANERAITVWDSSFGLKESGRFWSSPPSSKALAILSESESGKAKSAMAVAGVGDRIDLFVDHCRVQTMRI